MIMFWENKDQEVALYYLYMMADGNVSYSEEKIFDQLCGEMEIPGDTKQQIIEKCKQIGNGDILSVIVNEKIDDGAGKSFFGLHNKSVLARIIWNLINLGYADAVYSNAEKKIVKHLVDKWSIDKEVLQEFIDTADTMLALTKKKEWISTTFNKGIESDKREKKTDSEIKMLLDNVKLTIQELTM